MLASIEAATGRYPIYHARREEFKTGNVVPFRVSPTPLRLSHQQHEELHSIGVDVADYFNNVNTLYHNDNLVRELLDRGKPQIFLAEKSHNYLFIRPDIIMTPAGFSICEIETSPFGLALAEILNKAYRDEGHETLVQSGELPAHVQSRIPVEGTILYTGKTKQYSGQMSFLADNVFSGNDHFWSAGLAEDYTHTPEQNVYRGFYLSEHEVDPIIKDLLEGFVTNGSLVLPSLTPHLEEKAVLAFLWDKRYEAFFKAQLGYSTFNHLREVIPPTWIVGQEQFFAPGLPGNVSNVVDLATLSRAKRAFVLKSSGFNMNSSWSEGVHFLHQKSATNTGHLLQQAGSDRGSLHIIQDFRKAQDQSLSYEDGDSIVPITARVRLTPYFSSDQGRLVAIKATARENTDFIHASSDSINTAVA